MFNKTQMIQKLPMQRKDCKVTPKPIDYFLSECVVYNVNKCFSSFKETFFKVFYSWNGSGCFLNVPFLQITVEAPSQLQVLTLIGMFYFGKNQCTSVCLVVLLAHKQ